MTSLVHCACVAAVRACGYNITFFKRVRSASNRHEIQSGYFWAPQASNEITRPDVCEIIMISQLRTEHCLSGKPYL